MTSKVIAIGNVNTFIVPLHYVFFAIDQDGGIYAYADQPEVNEKDGVWLGGVKNHQSLYLGHAKDENTRHRWNEKIYVESMNENGSYLQCVWRW